MDLEGMKVFVAVVREGSILGASRTLGISRGAVRRRLDALEESVEVDLFVRDAGGLRTTPAGALFASRAEALLMDAELLVRNLQLTQPEPSGHVRVAVHASLSPLAELLTVVGVQERFSKLRIEHCVHPDPVHALHCGCDVAFTLDEVPDSEQWEVIELLRLPLRVLAAPSYLEYSPDILTPEDLRHHALFSWSGDLLDPTRWPLQNGDTLPVTPKLITNRMTTLHLAAHHGMGLALAIYDPTLNEHLTNSLVPVLEEEVGMELVAKFIVPRILKDIPHIRALYDFVSETVRMAELVS